MENLIYCKKGYFKVQNNIDFEFKKGDYFYIVDILTNYGLYVSEKTGIVYDMTEFFKKNYSLKGSKSIFIIRGYKYQFYLNEKEFYEHFLSEEKN